jgi:hypothetical protein
MSDQTRNGPVSANGRPHTATSEEFDYGRVRTSPAPGRDKISVGNGSEDVAKIQLAARWAEDFAPETGDTLEDTLRRFRRAYTYVDAVTKLMEPGEA